MGEAGGTLTIGARMDARDLVISVQDTGPGIPAAIEGQLFQSFVTMGKAGGTGLGLAIVKKIVEEHGGSVSVTSSSAGAIFEIRLPQTSASPDEPSSDKAVSGKRPSVRKSSRPGKGTQVKSPPR